MKNNPRMTTALLIMFALALGCSDDEGTSTQPSDNYADDYTPPELFATYAIVDTDQTAVGWIRRAGFERVFALVHDLLDLCRCDSVVEEPDIIHQAVIVAIAVAGIHRSA